MNYKIYLQILRLAYESIIDNAFRAFLTMLGIIIGAMTIITVIQLGQGAKKEIDEQFSNMSVTSILINAPASSDGKPSKLDTTDAQDIGQLEVIELAVPQLSGKIAVSGGSSSESFTAMGSSPEIFELMKVNFIHGEPYTITDDETRAKVAVLGATVTEELFGDRYYDAVGQEIVLGKKTFKVIGTIDYKGGSVGPTGIDDAIFIPYSAAYRYVLGKKGRFNINALATSVDELPIAMTQISELLRKNHNLKAGQIDDFRIRDMGSNVQAAQKSSRTMSILLGSIGTVVLLVGGIGIMNIMFVTVTERTKEIGLRKAIGAFDIQIKLQFIFESMLLSFFGLIIGGILATILFYILQKLTIAVVFTWWSYLIATIFVLIVGVFFGYAPAKKAAELNPIEALRYE